MCVLIAGFITVEGLFAFKAVDIRYMFVCCCWYIIVVCLVSELACKPETLWWR